jgi:hypothetical protein
MYSIQEQWQNKTCKELTDILNTTTTTKHAEQNNKESTNKHAEQIHNNQCLLSTRFNHFHQILHNSKPGKTKKITKKQNDQLYGLLAPSLLGLFTRFAGYFNS